MATTSSGGTSPAPQNPSAEWSPDVEQKLPVSTESGKDAMEAAAAATRKATDK